MNRTKYKKPSLKDFKKALRDKMGNLYKVAEAFKVSRGTIYNWTRDDPDFKAALRDERGQLFDECLGTARIVALGVPQYEYRLDGNGDPIRDENGRPIREMVGWVSRPDPNMLRYFMEKLGKKEQGFEEAVEEDDAALKNGIRIDAWIRKENEG